MQRDVETRGLSSEHVTSSFAKREPDSVQFVRPQSEFADLVMSSQPIHPRMLQDADNGKHPLRYKLVSSVQKWLERAFPIQSTGRCLWAACRHGNEE